MIPASETLSWGGSAQAAFLCPRCGVGAAAAGVCAADGARLVALELDHALVGQVVDGRFEVKALLGAGGMGAVYRAVQRSVEREVALKVVRRARAGDANAVLRFFREARAVSRLRHPNTITLFDFGQAEDGLLWMAMELLEGQELSDLLAGGQRLPAERAARVAMQVCDSLAEAHDVGLIHRDLKPENLMLVARHGHADFVKVLDFGIAKALVGDGGASTATGLITGTPAYMSPEAAQGQPVDGRSDLYSLGVVLYQMLEGRLPFSSADPLATLRAHVDTPVPPLVHAPPALARVVLRLLAKSPHERPHSAADARALLALPPEPVAEPRRTPWAPALAVVALLGLGAVAWLARGAAGPTAPGAAGAAQGGRAAGSTVAPVAAPEAGAELRAAAPAARPGGAAGPPEAPLLRAEAPGELPVVGRPSGTLVAPESVDTPKPPPLSPRRPDEGPAALQRRLVIVAPRAVVRVQSHPTGALVFDGAERLGETPYEVPVWSTPRTLALRLVGHRERAVQVDGAAPTVSVSLLPRTGRGLLPL